MSIHSEAVPGAGPGADDLPAHKVLQMPTYQYRCKTCGEDFEYYQSFTDDALTHCPLEGGPPGCVSPGEGEVVKVFGNIGITFKGSGFYKTDSRSSSTKAPAGPKPKESTGSDSGGSSSEAGSGSESGSSTGSGSKSDSSGSSSGGSTAKD